MVRRISEGYSCNFIKISHHRSACYRLVIEGLWHRCYQVVKVCKNGSGRRSGQQEIFLGMLSKCCTLKRACKRAGRLPVRLSVPVSVLRPETLPIARLSVQSTLKHAFISSELQKIVFLCQGPRFRFLMLIIHPWCLENSLETLHGNRLHTFNRIIAKIMAFTLGS